MASLFPPARRRPVRALAVPFFCIFFAASGMIRAESPAASAPAGRFQFRLAPGESLAVDKYQDIRVFDGLAWSSREEKNRIVLKVAGREAAGAALEGVFLTYSRSPRQTGEFRRDRDFTSRFIIADNGQYLVPDEFIMPNLRSLPTFPDRDLAPGDAWQADALETMDFGPEKIRIPLKVDYVYRGPAPLELENGTRAEFDRFTYVYSFNQPTLARAGILRISGYSSCELWFDRERGAPVFDTNRLVYNFLLADGSTQQFLFRIDSWWRKTETDTPEDRRRMHDEIVQSLATEEPQSRVRVRETDEGVILEMDAILFDHDSATLTPQARSRLEAIAGILNRYREREVRISGHTDSSGSTTYNQRLSEDRARAVVRALQNQHNVDGRRLSYQGRGETQPIAPNTDAGGRARNRRVEVLIVSD